MGEPYTRRRFVGSVGAVAAGVAMAGCSGDSGDGSDDGGGGDGGGSRVLVEMSDELTYEPETVAASVGDTVVRENVGSVGHSVTAYEDEVPGDAEYFASGGFDSEQAAREASAPGDVDAGDAPSGETYEHAFEVAGTYEYFCIPHESAGMIGTVEVEGG